MDARRDARARRRGGRRRRRLVPLRLRVPEVGHGRREPRRLRGPRRGPREAAREQEGGGGVPQAVGGAGGGVRGRAAVGGAHGRGLLGDGRRREEEGRAAGGV